MTDERVENEINCFQVNGTKDSPVLPQSILPNLDGFESLGETIFNGQHCQKWEKKENSRSDRRQDSHGTLGSYLRGPL